MAQCDICQRDMLKVDSCTASHISFGKKATKYPRQKYSAEADVADRCHDCNVVDGGYHHNGCDWERCPKCGMQFYGCDCGDEVTFYGLGLKKEA